MKLGVDNGIEHEDYWNGCGWMRLYPEAGQMRLLRRRLCKVPEIRVVR